MGEERAEALPRHAVEADEDAVVGKAGMAISAGDLARQHRPDRPVDVADFPLDPDRLAVLQRGSRRLDQLLVKRRSQAMVLTFRVVQRRAFADGLLLKYAGEVPALQLPVRQGGAQVLTRVPTPTFH